MSDTQKLVEDDETENSNETPEAPEEPQDGKGEDEETENSNETPEALEEPEDVNGEDKEKNDQEQPTGIILKQKPETSDESKISAKPPDYTEKPKVFQLEKSRDLGTHKIVIRPESRKGSPPLENKFKYMDKSSGAVTIVQQDPCWEKDEDDKEDVVKYRILIASALCWFFIGMEFFGGYISNSLVIAADAAQLLTVFSTLMASLFTLKLSRRRRLPPSEPLGWTRPEVMCALISILVTWVITSIVLYLAVERLIQGVFTIDVNLMLATSAFGVVANLVMGMVLHNHCHVQYKEVCDIGGKAAVHSNVRAAFYHIVGDFLFSMAVFTTALFIGCCPQWHIVDPISTVALSCLVLFITLTILRDILNMLVQEIPRGVYLTDILKALLSVEGVQQVFDLKLWALSIDKNAISANLIIRPGINHKQVLAAACRTLRSEFDFQEATLHIEEFQETFSPSQ